MHVSASTGFSSLKPNDFAGHRSTVRSCAALWLAEVSLFSFRFLLVLGYCAPISAFVLSAHPSFLGLFLEVSSTHSKSRLPQWASLRFQGWLPSLPLCLSAVFVHYSIYSINLCVYYIPSFPFLQWLPFFSFFITAPSVFSVNSALSPSKTPVLYYHCREYWSFFAFLHILWLMPHFALLILSFHDLYLSYYQSVGGWFWVKGQIGP